jgi:hypothetical protein
MLTFFPGGASAFDPQWGGSESAGALIGAMSDPHTGCRRCSPQQDSTLRWPPQALDRRFSSRIPVRRRRLDPVSCPHRPRHGPSGVTDDPPPADSQAGGCRTCIDPVFLYGWRTARAAGLPFWRCSFFLSPDFRHVLRFFGRSFLSASFLTWYALRPMTVSEFICMSRKVELKDRSAAQEHFLDLCSMFDVISPNAKGPAHAP